EYRLLCGGCRARPVAEGKSIMAADPVCEYSPMERPVIMPLPDLAEGEITWEEQAETRLNRIPGFIRKMVKKRAEAYVSGKNESVVQVHHLEELTARRFGSNGPGRPSLSKIKEMYRATK
ncbi:MAG: hypothetical protein HOE54_00825, partial [Gammaproteobacteria bacterium]|nr:hypothetical protein [Gammaproteobacteria bacterium]